MRNSPNRTARKVDLKPGNLPALRPKSVHRTADSLSNGGLKMSTEEQSNAFNEVRAILGKLDRSIDEARSRRLEPNEPARNEQNNSSAFARNPSSSQDREIGNTASTSAQTELQKKSASFGRAKPLNGQARPATSQWKSTGTDDDQLIG